MPCNDLTGGPFLRGVLVKKDTEEIVDIDPVLRFVFEDNRLWARFDGSAARFEVTCTEEGSRRRLSFTREVGNVKTTYTGVAAPIQNRAVFVILRGTFVRITGAEDEAKTIIIGDWETERPT